MLKQDPALSRLAKVSLMFVGLMWVWPFLYYRHAYPLTTFYQEWGAVVLGLCAMPVLVTQRFWKQPEIPRSVLLPVGMMLLVLLQFALGKIGYFSQALLFTLYLLWAALLIMLGQCLREEFGLPVLSTVLAAFLLVGAEISTLFGVIQHFHWHSFLDPVVTVKTSLAVFGNMGQPNHFANYISLGLISLGLLHSRWKLKLWQVGLLAVPMLFVLVLSGSRSAWLYLLFIVGLAFFWQRRDKTNKSLLYYSLFLLIGFGLMNFVVQIPFLSGNHDSVTTFGRMMDAASGLESSGTGAADVDVKERSIRLHIWYEAWLIFKQFPLLGAGFGQFGWQHFLLGPALHNTSIIGLYNNAHNLVMETAAEMGLAGLLVLFGTLALWILQLYRSPRTLYHWWGGSLLAVLGIHSLLEYPLWYAYFLGVAAVTLGILDSSTYRLELRNIGRLSVASILLLGVLSMSQVWLGYRSLEELTSIRQPAESNEDYFKKLFTLRSQALLQPYAEVVMNGMMEARAENLTESRELNENVMHFVPINTVVYREVILLALSGEQAAAQTQLERAIWAFPEGYPAALDQINSFAMKDPTHFAALLEFAPKIYEERQLAIHTK
ncbi:MAG: Wzy polymerase domain-containing protein [Nitrosomonadales bacterium]